MDKGKDVIEIYKERRRNNDKANVLILLFKETRNHMGCPNNGDTIYSFQFDSIVDKIDAIYHPKVVLDNELIERS